MDPLQRGAWRVRPSAEQLLLDGCPFFPRCVRRGREEIEATAADELGTLLHDEHLTSQQTADFRRHDWLVACSPLSTCSDTLLCAPGQGSQKVVHALLLPSQRNRSRAATLCVALQLVWLQLN
jgi:hypothetical protein